MAQVYPFRAFRYNTEKAHAPYDQLLTQPYDKISPAMQEKYYAADPHNLIVVEKGRVYPNDGAGNNVYTRAAAALQDWIAKAVVTQDEAPAFYGYTQEYTVPGTQERRTRRGFIGAGKLEEYSAHVVFRHEHTLSGPKADRLEMLRNTKTHTGQLFMLYADPARRVDVLLEEAEAATKPVTEMRDEYDVVHRLWMFAEPKLVAGIQEAMRDQKLVIADGHHRYETALNYRNERRVAGRTAEDAPYERAMMTFVNTHSEGLTILPTHRVAARLHDFDWTETRRHLEPWFAAEAFAFHDEASKRPAREKFLARLVAAREMRAIGAYPVADDRKRAFYVLTLRPGADLARLLPGVSALQRGLDVVLLHDGILEPALGITPQSLVAEANLTYERDAQVAMEAVDSGAAQVAFFLNACDVAQVMEIATSGEVMPQKSTDFFPKLMSGITMYRVDG
jgi:uncharacterized protein (DUF1015 family)